MIVITLCLLGTSLVCYIWGGGTIKHPVILNPLLHGLEQIIWLLWAAGVVIHGLDFRCEDV